MGEDVNMGQEAFSQASNEPFEDENSKFKSSSVVDTSQTTKSTMEATNSKPDTNSTEKLKEKASASVSNKFVINFDNFQTDA